MGVFCCNCKSKINVIQNDFDFELTITNNNSSTLFLSQSDIINIHKPFKQGPIFKKIISKRKITVSN